MDAYKRIRYENNFHLLNGYFRRGDKLYVRYNPYDYPNVEVNTQRDFRGEFVPAAFVKRDEWGFPVDGAVIMQEYKSHKWDETKHFKEVEMKKIDISDVVPQMQGHKLEKINWLPKKGQELLPDVEIKNLPITAHEARKRLREELKIERLTTLQSQWLDMRLGDSVSEERLKEVIEEYRNRFIPESDSGLEILKAAQAG